MQGVVIDGVAASGKSTIIQHLNHKLIEESPWTSKFFLSEHYTQRVLEHLKDSHELTGHHVKSHIRDIIRTLELFQNMLEGSKFSKSPGEADMFVILERFILSYLTDSNFRNGYSIYEIKRDLSKLSFFGIKQVALILPEDKIRDYIMSTIKYRNEKWSKYLNSIGSEKQIVKYYIDWQKKFKDNIKQFEDTIETIVIENNDNNFDFYSQIIFNEVFQ